MRATIVSTVLLAGLLSGCGTSPSTADFNDFVGPNPEAGRAVQDLPADRQRRRRQGLAGGDAADRRGGAGGKGIRRRT